MREWVTRFKLRTGRTLMIYTYPDFIDTSLDGTLGNVPLWYAYYNSGVPADKGGWTSWEFIQYTNKGRVPGINGDVDLNEYKGSEADLMAAYNRNDQGKGPDAPEWKEAGRQWLIKHAGISRNGKRKIRSISARWVRFWQNMPRPGISKQEG
ncbi:Lysozyme M1 precursor [Paenibacillus sp. P1XP2]|nr:Lysozyme M1 precursor [Paenibacillus sp. P1XP2]